MNISQFYAYELMNISVIKNNFKAWSKNNYTNPENFESKWQV